MLLCTGFFENLLGVSACGGISIDIFARELCIAKKSMLFVSLFLELSGLVDTGTNRKRAFSLCLLHQNVGFDRFDPKMHINAIKEWTTELEHISLSLMKRAPTRNMWMSIVPARARVCGCNQRDV